MRALPLLLCLAMMATVSPREAPAQDHTAGRINRLASPGEAPPPAASDAIVDVNTIDPGTFNAVAFHVPEGMAPRIDGKLDDPVWAMAQVFGHFIQREPRVGTPASEPTEFRVLYDDRYLYFGVWAYDDDPARITASELKRDSLLKKGDQIKINIDSFHDRRNAFFFSTNPLGARKDANSADNGRVVNYDWNAVWENGTSIDERGWYVEIAIPLSQLRFKGKPGETTWGLNVGRVVIRKNEDSYWVPFPREWGTTGMARMSHAGNLANLKDIRAHRSLEFLPYAAPQVSRDYAAGTPTSALAKYGFDARIGLTSDLTADMTYRTDFAQVEADQEVVNLSRFSLFFPEKRQFFTESTGIFDYGHVTGAGAGGTADTGPGLLPLFYSRRVGLLDGQEVPILVGGKVTGRVGPYTLGFMNIETDTTTRLAGGGAGGEVPKANYTVVRAKRSLFSQSSVGTILLSRDAENETIGMDANLLLGRHATLTGLFAKTLTRGRSGRDLAGAFDFMFRADRYNYGFTYLDVQEAFNAEMGYIQRTDIRSPKLRAAWTPRPKWPRVRQVTLGAALEYFENHAGTPVSRNSSADFTILRQDSSSVMIGATGNYDLLQSNWRVGPLTIPTGGYAWNTFKSEYISDQSRRIYGGTAVELGGYYNGNKRTYKANLNLVALRTLLMENSYTRNELRLPGQPSYATNTISTRVSFSFSPDLFVKTFVQYNDERHLASFNVLLWYIYRPGSDLYVVYNEGRDTGLPAPSRNQVRSRSLSVKLTYWLSR